MTPGTSAASSPNVFTLNGERVVGFGAKAGVYYLFDAATGALKWNTLVGPGGDQGGFEWGSAYDGSRVYVSLTDQHHIPYQLTENGVLTSQTTTGGSWAALDPATGKILWQTPDPQTETIAGATVGVWDLAPVSVANGVVYTASMAKSGNEMYALDAATGSILWQFAAGSSVNAAPSIVNGSVYWGSGYSKSAEGNGNNQLYAFSIGGVSDTTPPVYDHQPRSKRAERLQRLVHTPGHGVGVGDRQPRWRRRVPDPLCHRPCHAADELRRSSLRRLPVHNCQRRR